MEVVHFVPLPFSYLVLTLSCAKGGDAHVLQLQCKTSVLDDSALILVAKMDKDLYETFWKPEGQLI